MKSASIRWILLSLASSALLFGSGCAGKRHAMPPLATIKGVSGHFRVGQIIRPEIGQALSFERLIDELGSRDLVFIGEVHDNPDHHLIEVQILQALMARHPFSAVAMEFFEKPQQAILDRYMDGVIDEEAFLEAVNWKKTWGFDYHYYRPLLLAVKERGGRILAINAPHEIVRKVARTGLESLSSEERKQVAEHIDLSRKNHREYVYGAYQEHDHAALDKFDYFYQAQCVWEDTMAETTARFLKTHGGKMVVFAGNGHIIYKFGIPDRTVERIPVSMATVILHPITGPLEIDREMGDYVWLTLDCP